MPQSHIVSPGYWDTMPPSAFDGAQVYVVYNKNNFDIGAIVAYVGLSALHITSVATRQYDFELKGASGIPQYAKAIVERTLGIKSTYIGFTFSHARWPMGGCGLEDVAKSVIRGAPNVSTGRTFPPAHGAGILPVTLVLNPGEDMAKQMQSSDASDLINMLSANSPATEPAVPVNRGVEGNPVDNKIPPHRRSVIKGMRDGATYIKSLKG